MVRPDVGSVNEQDRHTPPSGSCFELAEDLMQF
jgi:hypothetical protein